MTTSNSKVCNAGWKPFLVTTGILALVLLVFFFRSLSPWLVVFSNDGPLGGLVEEQNQLPQTFTGMWADLNSIGSGGGSSAPAISSLLRMILGPVGFAKFYAPIALLIVGISAWTFFRALKLSHTAALLGALASMLNSTFFSTACWGVAAQQIALGMDFFALALIVSNTSETPRSLYWARLALAGLCVGMNVMEAADIGALYSILIALFVFYRAIVTTSGSVAEKSLKGFGQVAAVALFAGLIAVQTILSLVSTQIQGVAGSSPEDSSKAQRWDWATQWSMPKKETLGLFVPGVFGYKMDTPKDMVPAFQESYQNGNYWGGVGRDPSIDRFLESGKEGNPPQGMMRFTGGGNYCGILVWLVAAWIVAQSLRKTGFVATEQKRMIWFWAAVTLICIPMAWGRFAPLSHSSDGILFYSLFYKLPYFSTIRNPTKFLIFMSWGVVILFAYGLDFLSRRYLAPSTAQATSVSTDKAFNRRWMAVIIALFAISAVGWLIYNSETKRLAEYLTGVGFGDPELALGMAKFSVGQAGWFVVLFAGAILLMGLVLFGHFIGAKSRWAMILLGLFVLIDLGRADVPYVGHWNYQLKYDVGSLNPILKQLADKPYEHRVAILPFRAPQQLGLFEQLYRIEWAQHHFPYYNIQSLDIVQMPRIPADLQTFESALQFRGTPDTMHLLTRRWALTNTRYLLGPAGFIEALNQQVDPEQHRFRIVETFNVVAKPGIANPTKLEELTATLAGTNRQYALFEFTGALPRAKLFSNWQVPAADPAAVAELKKSNLDPDALKELKGLGTNDFITLQKLAAPDFDPHRTVFVADNVAIPPSTNATATNSGSVEYVSYAPKDIRLKTQSGQSSVLLLSDKYDPNWRVFVDGKEAPLLRCNYIMRGVYLTPGSHAVDFSYRTDMRPMYVTASFILIGVLLSGYVLAANRRTASAGEATKG
jgi:hypothetical protein